MFPNGFNPYGSFPPNYFTMPPFSNNSLNGLMGARIGNGIGTVARNGGIFSKIFGARGINWQGLLNNTSRTLGVINQAIPIVKQVGPMYNNMKSMLKVASLFRDETEPSNKKNSVSKKDENTINEVKEEKENTTNYNNYSVNSPNFFI